MNQRSMNNSTESFLLQLSVVQRIELEDLVVSYANPEEDLESPPGFFFLGETLSIGPRSIKGFARTYIFSASGLEDIEQDTPSFNVTFDRVRGLKLVMLVTHWTRGIRLLLSDVLILFFFFVSQCLYFTRL